MGYRASFLGCYWRAVVQIVIGIAMTMLLRVAVFNKKKRWLFTFPHLKKNVLQVGAVSPVKKLNDDESTQVSHYP